MAKKLVPYFCVLCVGVKVSLIHLRQAIAVSVGWT